MNLYDKLLTASRFIEAEIMDKPEIGIVLGSGLGEFESQISDTVALDYGDIPFFKKVSIPGHMGRLLAGTVGTKRIVALQGRYHFYEGHDISDVVFPVQALCRLGINTLILTNAAGAIHRDLTPGDLMPIRDHVNLMGTHPLRGANDIRIGPRFPDMTEIYCRVWLDRTCQVLKEMGLKARPGVYGAMSGPSYETPAEIRMLAAIGVDAVGMSTVPEAIAARHMGVTVAGISCITNYAAGISESSLDHDEVTRTAGKVKNRFNALLTGMINRL
ncbi:MAG: purine-nucleoside phosphorylase [Planctomycetota bacterium]